MIEPELKHLLAAERSLRDRRGFRQLLDEIANCDYDEGFRADEEDSTPGAQWGPNERECLEDLARAVLNA